MFPSTAGAMDIAAAYAALESNSGFMETSLYCLLYMEV